MANFQTDFNQSVMSKNVQKKTLYRKNLRTMDTDVQISTMKKKMSEITFNDVYFSFSKVR